jgi:LDH2 family malate/lactate/ureidoglycolate dehydrogenase
MARVGHDRLHGFVADVLTAVGVPTDDADLVADSLVRAELWGHQSHGVLRLPWYVARLRSGVMSAVTKPDLVVNGGAVAVVDGLDGVGQVVTAHAARQAIARAKAHGAGVVGVRNSNHFGTAAYFTRMAPPAGCVGLLTTNSSPAMAPWGGRVKAVGSNPWSVAVPAGSYGVCVMDISNSGVARGKIYLAQQRGEPIPTGWAITGDGAPTTDPASALAGAILPMGEHKGYAISVMWDVLAGVLTGSGFGTAVSGPYQSERRSRAGHLYLALDIETFTPLVEFAERMERLIGQLKAVPRAEGFDEIYYPGEPEARAERRGRREGIVLPAKTVADLGSLADDLGLARIA